MGPSELLQFVVYNVSFMFIHSELHYSFGFPNINMFLFYFKKKIIFLLNHGPPVLGLKVGDAGQP